MAVLARARENIAKNMVGAEDVQFVFVSVDPNRDIVSRLKQYVGHFHKTFLGVTGDNPQIRNLAGQLGAAYQVLIEPGLKNYPVNHATAVFLVDPRARYHAVFTPPHDAEVISRRFGFVRELEARSEKRDRDTRSSSVSSADRQNQASKENSRRAVNGAVLDKG